MKAAPKRVPRSSDKEHPKYLLETVQGVSVGRTVVIGFPEPVSARVRLQLVKALHDRVNVGEEKVLTQYWYCNAEDIEVKYLVPWFRLPITSSSSRAQPIKEHSQCSRR